MTGAPGPGRAPLIGAERFGVPSAPVSHLAPVSARRRARIHRPPGIPAV